MIQWGKPATAKMMPETFPADPPSLLAPERATRENPYHDQNGNFTSAGGAAGSAQSAASEAKDTIATQGDAWIQSAKDADFQSSEVSQIAQDLDRAETLLDDAQSWLGDAQYSYDSQTGDEPVSLAFASNLYDANIAIGGAGNMLDAAISTFAGEAPDDLKSLADDVKSLGDKVSSMYDTAAEESGFKPYG